MYKKIFLAIQKKGRLNKESEEILERCGLKIKKKKEDILYAEIEKYPINIIYLRDDDIPKLIIKKKIDLGILGENIILEKMLKTPHILNKIIILYKLKFGYCHLSISIDKEKEWKGLNTLKNELIITSYTNILRHYFIQKDIKLKIFQLKGSIEISPYIKLSPIICDLVSTGNSLKIHNLYEKKNIFNSQACLIQYYKRPYYKQNIIDNIIYKINKII